MPKRYSTRDVERVLLARGFSKLGQRGSHVKYGDGVRIVIDSGLARRARFDQAAGVTRLVTERASLSAATQRAADAANHSMACAMSSSVAAWSS